MDDVIFLGDNIPLEVLRFLPSVQHQLVTPKTVHKVIQYVVVFLTEASKVLSASSSNVPTELNTEMETELKQNLDTFLNDKKQKKKLSKYDLEQIDFTFKQGVFPVYFTAIYTIFKAAVRQHLKIEFLQDQLSKMSLPDAVTKSICGFFDKKREELEKASQQNTKGWFHHLTNLRWRVDITISSSMMTRVFKPVILMQMELSNGAMKTFEVPLQQFHQLRLAVATVLNDMHNIEQHPVMKIE